MEQGKGHLLSQSIRPARLRGAMAKGVLILCLGLTVWQVLATALLPPLGSDALVYHLPLGAHWLHGVFLQTVDLPFHDQSAEHSPMLAQILYYLLMHVTGDDALVWVVQPAFLLGTLGLAYLTVRLLGGNKVWAMLATSLMVLFGPFLAAAQLAGNDLVLTFGEALFCYGLLLMRLRRGRGIILGASGIAIMLAAKTVGVIYAGPAILLLAIGAYREGRRHRRRPPARRVGRRRSFLPSIAAVLIILAGGAFFIHNALVYRNPLYPARVEVMGRTIFPGLYNFAVLAPGWSWAAFKEAFFHRANLPFAPGPIGGCWLWLGFAGSVILALFRRSGRRRFGPLALCLALPLMDLLLYFQLVPFWPEHRLLFPVYYLLLLGGGNTLAGLGRLGWPRLNVGLPWLLAAALLMCLFFATDISAVGYWLLAFGAFVAALPRWPRRWGRRIAAPALACAAVAAALTLPLWLPSYQQAREKERFACYEKYYGSFGRVWARVQQLTARGGTTVAYAGTPLILPLFGSQLQNQVVYVPLSPEDRPTAVVLHRGDNVIARLAEARRKTADDDYWLAGLARQGVRLLVLDTKNPAGTALQEQAIIDRHPGRFHLLMENDGVLLLEVLPPRVRPPEVSGSDLVKRLGTIRAKPVQ